MDDWRSLVYPLGFLSSLAFGARFIIQWMQSERAHSSIVPRSFWQISLMGNLLLLFHSFIQIQYHICIIQGFNAVISWRNLNLMQRIRPPISFKWMFPLFIIAFLMISFLFVLQDYFLEPSVNWFRIPKAPWETNEKSSIPFLWHIMGFISFILFSSRFWAQWWVAEKAQMSFFPKSFWWLSLIGAILSIVYFFHIGDTVNLVGPLVGLIPYTRNLMLQSRAEQVLR